MKTKNLIKALQKEDPSGESHVRASDGEPIIAVELKPGYWDGYYIYEDENGNRVYSEEGTKVDIMTREDTDFIERNLDNWREKIIFKFINYNENQRKEKEDGVFKELEKIEKEIRDFNEQSIKNFFFSMYKNLKEGHRIWKTDDRNKPMGYYWELLNGEEKQLNFGELEVIKNTDFFEEYITSEGHTQILLR